VFRYIANIQVFGSIHYGRVTSEMMENYLPAAGDEPDATRHDIQYSKWNSQNCLSKTMKLQHREKNILKRHPEPT